MGFVRFVTLTFLKPKMWDQGIGLCSILEGKFLRNRTRSIVPRMAQHGIDHNWHVGNAVFPLDFATTRKLDSNMERGRPVSFREGWEWPDGSSQFQCEGD